MEFEDYITRKKEVYSSILDFIDSSDDSDSEFEFLIDVFNSQNIFDNKFEVLDLLQLISKIAHNHHPTSIFFQKDTSNIKLHNKRKKLFIIKH